jgi:predicted nucleotidyltransferase
VTDRQEESIETSRANIDSHLQDEDLGLGIDEVFLSGSYERDTIIKPAQDELLDVDIFAVISHDGVTTANELPDPKSILAKFKRKLESLPEYKDKVKQDRPCVTVSLSDKKFDVLPSYRFVGGYFYIPNDDLKSWQLVPDPAVHTKRLNEVNSNRDYLGKKIIRAVKHWNRGHGWPFLSIQIEQIAINIFSAYGITNLEEGIRSWFQMAHLYTSGVVYKDIDSQNYANEKVQKVFENLSEAKSLLDEGDDGRARKIWKKVFGDQFKVGDVEQAKRLSEALGSGDLKYSSLAGLSLLHGKAVPKSTGFFGDQEPDV